jgi:hypothetical protein
MDERIKAIENSISRIVDTLSTAHDLIKSINEEILQLQIDQQKIEDFMERAVKSNVLIFKPKAH